MTPLRSLPILLLLAAGCGSNLGGEARAEAACPTLTDEEFRVLWNLTTMERDLGGTDDAILSNLYAACADPWVFDRSSECRSCLTAIVEGVY